MSTSLAFRLPLLICLSLAALSVFSTGLMSSAQGKSVAIVVLDGRNGKPISHEHLLIFLGVSQEDLREKKNHVDLQTDADGLALLPIPESKISRVQIWVDFHTLCQKVPNDQSYSVEEIGKTGLSAPNTCGPDTYERVPNQLVVFARPRTFWERIRG